MPDSNDTQKTPSPAKAVVPAPAPASSSPTKATLKPGLKATLLAPGEYLPGKGNHVEVDKEVSVSISAIAPQPLNGHVCVTVSADAKVGDLSVKSGKNLYIYTAHTPNALVLSK